MPAFTLVKSLMLRMNNTDTYQPVSCELHSQYELAIMHKSKLQLSYLSDDKLPIKCIVNPVDVQTKDKAEYLIAITSENKNIRLRLDHIIEMRILDEN